LQKGYVESRLARQIDADRDAEHIPQAAYASYATLQYLADSLPRYVEWSLSSYDLPSIFDSTHDATPYYVQKIKTFQGFDTPEDNSTLNREQSENDRDSSLILMEDNLRTWSSPERLAAARHYYEGAVRDAKEELNATLQMR
jgi:hypothetical protein